MQYPRSWLRVEQKPCLSFVNPCHYHLIRSDVVMGLSWQMMGVMNNRVGQLRLLLILLLGHYIHLNWASHYPFIITNSSPYPSSLPYPSINSSSSPVTESIVAVMVHQTPMEFWREFFVQRRMGAFKRAFKGEGG